MYLLWLYTSWPLGFSYIKHSLYCYSMFKETCLWRAYLSVSEYLDSLNMNNPFSSNPFSRRGEKNALIWQWIHCYLMAPHFACRSCPSGPIATNVLLVLVWRGDCTLLFSISQEQLGLGIRDLESVFTSALSKVGRWGKFINNNSETRACIQVT